MASQKETGHSKNVANLQKLIEQIKTYPKYNPSIDNLKIDSLMTLYSDSLSSIEELTIKRNFNKSSIHLRQEVYKGLKQITIRIVSYLELLPIKEGTLSQSKSLKRIINGYSRTNSPVDNLDESNDDKIDTSLAKDNKTLVSKPVSRQSYTELASNFHKLIQLVESIESYNPNVEDLKLKSLKDYYKSLANSTQDVDKTGAELKATLINRNNILYNSQDGLYKIAQNVKKYIKSVYGTTSSEYSYISKISFSNTKI